MSEQHISKEFVSIGADTVIKHAVRPVHIAAGIGNADRALLATCLAFYDESSISAYIGRLVKDTSRKVASSLTKAELKEATDAVEKARLRWVKSSLTDQELRLILWVQIRAAVKLPPRLSLSYCGAEILADDLSATIVKISSPPPSVFKKSRKWLQKQGLWRQTEGHDEDAASLHDVVEAVLNGLSSEVQSRNGDDEFLAEAVDKAVDAMSQLSSDDQARIRQELGVEDINADAVRKMLITGGSLTAFSGGVGMAGFSAYILAAKASAFIPFVSGPGLVSMVAVVSNPVTAIAGTAGAVWWLGSSAGQKIRELISVQIVAMLAIQGLMHSRAGLTELLASFYKAPTLNENSRLSAKLISEVKNEWRSIAYELPTGHLTCEDRWRVFEKPITHSSENKLLKNELQNASAMTVMTVGDMFYHAAQICPEVMAAADFAYLENIDGPIDFALLALGIGDGAANRLKGYVAEQVVAARLQADGHVVSMPETANEQGWDLLVDGQPVQVKCHSDVGGITSHFEKYDYPVLANIELQGKIPEEYVDRVFFIDDVSNELISQITDMSVEAAQGMSDPDVAFMGFTISAARSAKGLYEGKLTSSQALEQIMLDGSVRVGLAVSGNIAGASLGFLVLGPAGAWVFGAGLPVLAQSQTGKVVNKLKSSVILPETQRWEQRAHELLDDLQSAGIAALHSRSDQLSDFLAKVKLVSAESYLIHRAQDQIAFTNECITRKTMIERREGMAPETRFAETIKWLTSSNVHALRFQSELRELNDCMDVRPGFKEELRSDEARQKIDQARTYGKIAAKKSYAVGEKLSRWFFDSKNKYGK